MDTNRPNTSEFNDYYKQYIDLVPGDIVIEGLRKGLRTTMEFFQEIPEDKCEYRYEDTKWTPKEILLHLIDTERVFSYRALQFSRSANPTLPGFDQDEFVQNSNANSRNLKELLEEYQAVRTATLCFAKSCSEANMKRTGIASNSTLSVRAALYIIAGHELHHCRIISERYL